MKGTELAGEVSTTEPYVVPAGRGEKRFTVAAVDLGIKANTPRMMAERGIEVHVLPATSTLEDVLAVQPDGLFFSNGPGDPAATIWPGRAARGRAGRRAALLRDLLRQPALRPGARLRHLQAQVRPPRDQPAGDGPYDGQGRGDRAQPRLRRRRPARGSHRDEVGPGHREPRLPQRRRGRGLGAARRRGSAEELLGAVPPRGGGRPTRCGVPVRPVHRVSWSARGRAAKAEAAAEVEELGRGRAQTDRLSLVPR